MQRPGGFGPQPRRGCGEVGGVTKALSLNDIRRCGKFVADWSSEPGEECQEAQSVRDLLGACDITKTKAALYKHRARSTPVGHHERLPNFPHLGPVPWAVRQKQRLNRLLPLTLVG